MTEWSREKREEKQVELFHRVWKKGSERLVTVPMPGNSYLFRTQDREEFEDLKEKAEKDQLTGLEPLETFPSDSQAVTHAKKIINGEPREKPENMSTEELEKAIQETQKFTRRGRELREEHNKRKTGGNNG